MTCVDFSPEDGLHGNRGDGLVGSGSQDTTVLLWKWSGKVNRVTGPLSLIEGKYTKKRDIHVVYRLYMYCLVFISNC